MQSVAAHDTSSLNQVLPTRGPGERLPDSFKRGINPDHAPKLIRQLTALDVTRQPKDMSAPGWRLHELKGASAGHWSITVSGNWRITFGFEGADVILVDYLDYH